MKKLLGILLSIGLLCLSIQVAVAQEATTKPFVLSDIKVEGLHRISLGTVLNYLPVQVGQPLEPETTPGLIRALYKTGFFSRVSLEQQGSTLIIKVQERPTIGSIQITGNSIIATQPMQDSLKNIGLAQGRVYDPSILENVKSSLQNQYYDQGHYGAQVTTSVTAESQNRVAIAIHIEEGTSANIYQIKIIGNHSFSERALLRQFGLGTTHFWSFITKENQYSKEKLDADLEKMRSFYLDQGYINFKIESAQVSLTPDKKRVYLVIRIKEGPQYKLKGFGLSGQLIVPEPTLRALVAPILKDGDVFSRRKVTQVSTKIGDYLGDYGYSLALVRPVPEIDEQKQEVFVEYVIETGNRIYVRQISFVGNSKTEDEVLRRELRQQEGAIISLEKIKLSEKRLNNLGYLKNVNVQTRRVEGTADEVDLEIHVAEAPSASLSAAAGYSDTRGFLFNAGFNQPNFLGTGDSVGVNFGMDQYVTTYSASYFNPYYTKDGIGRGVNIYATTSNYDKNSSEISNYTMDQYGGSVYYAWPLSEHNSVTLGYGYQLTNLNIRDSASLELLEFKEEHGEHFNNALLTAGWSYVDFDRAIFPRQGYAQYVDSVFAAPLSRDSLTYYKFNYSARLYQPLIADFILSLRGEVGYGGGIGDGNELPFYENYHAGGIGVQGEVRGYKGYSIGPKDSQYNNIGGNFLVDGTVGLIIPTPFAKDTLRPTLFMDFGNVYTNASSLGVSPGYQRNCSQDSGPVRMSAGLALEWRSPIGPLVISLAKALNPQRCDDIQVFQFTVGTSL